MTKSKPLPSLIAVIDIGTHKTVGLVGQIIDGKARMLSFSERRTEGVVKGTVVDLEKLHNCVHEAVNDLERVAPRSSTCVSRPCWTARASRTPWASKGSVSK